MVSATPGSLNRSTLRSCCTNATTSNRTREIHDAVKRRCFYHWVDYPDARRELEILRRKAPQAAEALSREVVAFVQQLRKVDLFKLPGVAETIDWANCLAALDRVALDPETVNNTLGVLLKYRDDLERIAGEEAGRAGRRGEGRGRGVAPNERHELLVLPAAARRRARQHAGGAAQHAARAVRRAARRERRVREHRARARGARAPGSGSTSAAGDEFFDVLARDLLALARGGRARRSRLPGRSLARQPGAAAGRRRAAAPGAVPAPQHGAGRHRGAGRDAPGSC